LDLVYPDYNCFQREFDDRSQVRVQLEILACQELFARAEAGVVTLVWSFVHEDEARMCPVLKRRMGALRLSLHCAVRVGPDEAIRGRARALQQAANLGANDAVHIACAAEAGAGYFVTCDDSLLKRARGLVPGLAVLNPLAYVEQEWP